MYFPLSLLALWGLILAIGEKVPGSALTAGLLLVYPIPYYLTFPTVRYRHAIEPELLILSVYFLYAAATHFRTRMARAQGEARISDT
jgi:hypothetical protein